MDNPTRIDVCRNKDLFLKVSSFTRYLLEEVLPAEVHNWHGEQSSSLGEIAEECQHLGTSLRTFKQLSNCILPSDAETSISQGNESVPSNVKISKEHTLKLSVLFEDVKNKVVSLQDIMKVRPYYCKICNLTTLYELDFNRHCTTKKHIMQANEISGPLVLHKCKKCQFLLLVPKSEINQILSLPAHNILDEYINKLKVLNDKTYSKKCTTDVLNKEDSHVSDNSEEELLSENQSQFYKVFQLFQVIKKEYKKGAHLLEEVPHYCNVCDIVVTSVSKFIDHTSSKEHIAAVNSSNKLINVFKCEICGFLITGYDTAIDELKKSISHQKFDKLITGLKVSKEQAKPKKETSIKENTDEKVDFYSNNISKDSIQESLVVLEILKKSINSIIEVLRLPADLKKRISCCCFLCKKVFSSNDFKQHIISKKHITLESSSAGRYHAHYCTICSLSLYGRDSDIRSALETSEHINLHKRIKYLFHSNNTADSRGNNSTTVFNNVSSSDNSLSSYSNGAKNLFLVNKAKGQLSKSKTINSHVPDKFLTLNCKLQCGDFSKSGFCRPCKKAVNIIKGWTQHLSCSKHKQILSKQEFENIALPCEHCSLQILGDQIHGNPCMTVHLKLNHSKEKRTDTQSEPLFIGPAVEISERYSRECSIQSMNTETIGSSSILGLSAESLPIQLSSDCSDDVQYSLLNHYNADQCNIFSSEQFISKESSNSNKNNACLEIFEEFLNKRKTLFIKQGLKQFGGMCLFCVETYDDFYEWLLHLKNPCHKLAKELDCVEKECNDCNLSLFGKRTIVESEFWYHKKHISLDSMFTQ